MNKSEIVEMLEGLFTSPRAFTDQYIIDAAQAAIDEIEQTQWQPIETAPKDGTQILIIYDLKVKIGWFEDGDLYLSDSADQYGPRSVCHGGMYGRVATHWMHLPPLSSVGDTSKEGKE